MICPPCGSDNQAARRYCGECGSFLFAACGRCGFENLAVDKFCGGCGDSLGAERTRARRATRLSHPPAMSAVEPMTAPAAARAASSPAPMPVPTPTPVAKSETSRADALSAAELTELLHGSNGTTKGHQAAQQGSALPEGAITQDTLDRLFGG